MIYKLFMKKFYLMAVLFCFCLSGCINFNPNKEKDSEEKVEEETEVVADPNDDAAMESSNHLKFKGVPIDGKLKEFVSRMKRKGFKSLGSEDGVEVLKGDFAAYKECVIYVSTLDNKDLVSRISVVFPKQETWEYLYGDYKNLKGLLTEKYGQPSEVTEKFQDRYIDDDNDRMHAVRMDKCKYESRFKTDKGEIVLWIEHESVMSCFVVLCYKDKINGGIIKDIAKDDL